MEKILEEINNEIKKIAQSKEIDTQKLTELINTRDRLKAYNITSVSNVQGFNRPAMLTMPHVPFELNQVNRNGLYDSITDMANLYMKNQVKNLKNDKLDDLMNYYRFISDLEQPYNKEINIEINIERYEIKRDLEYLIMKEFKTIITEKKNKEKDKIVDTTLENNQEVII